MDENLNVSLENDFLAAAPFGKYCKLFQKEKYTRGEKWRRFIFM